MACMAVQLAIIATRATTKGLQLIHHAAAGRFNIKSSALNNGSSILCVISAIRTTGPNVLTVIRVTTLAVVQHNITGTVFLHSIHTRSNTMWNTICNFMCDAVLNFRAYQDSR